ncbi:MAG TPA: OsmC family protein [Polyangiaceae bacterium]|nr:OsmC family protein [Polyangiaceae bacterium]
MTTTSPTDELFSSSAVVHGSAQGFAQTITTGGHRLLADEPLSMGGMDTGPSPYDLLIAALGACTSMTVSLYARRKQWPLEAVTVKITHRKVHAADCEECEKKSGLLDRIERGIELHGALTEEQRSRLLEIANKCPVHKTLTSQVQIVTELVQLGARELALARWENEGGAVDPLPSATSKGPLR